MEYRLRRFASAADAICRRLVGVPARLAFGLYAGLLTVGALLGLAVGSAAAITPSAVVTSVTAMGTSAFGEVVPIVLGVGLAGIILILAIVGVRLVYRVVLSRRHSV